MGRWEPNSSVYALDMKEFNPPKQLLHIISEANRVKCAIFGSQEPFKKLLESRQEVKITNCRAMMAIDQRPNSMPYTFYIIVYDHYENDTIYVLRPDGEVK